MEKVYRIQRICFVCFIVFASALFVFALWFMTDFKDLFGLELKINKSVADFHDVVLQKLNQRMFWFALSVVACIIVLQMLELPGKVPDRFAMMVSIVVLLVAAGCCIYFLVALPTILRTYRALDFSNVVMEGAVEYHPSERAFVLGRIVFSSSAVFFIAYVFVLVASHRISMRHKRESKESCHGR